MLKRCPRASFCFCPLALRGDRVTALQKVEGIKKFGFSLGNNYDNNNTTNPLFNQE